jgi:hypothetical protein
MKEKILNVLAKHPDGLRLRSIGSALGVWHVKLIADITELEAEGKVVSHAYSDRANMEFYNIWQLA